MMILSNSKTILVLLKSIRLNQLRLLWLETYFVHFIVLFTLFSSELFLKYVAEIIVDMYLYLKTGILSKRVVGLKGARMRGILGFAVRLLKPLSQSWGEKKGRAP